MIMLEEVTPLILTWNEAPNLERMLERLKWARQILIVDSGSTDATLGIARQYSSVRIITREFDTFAQQCNHGLAQIDTAWVLSLDADYVLSEGFAEEAAQLIQSGQCMGYRTRFRYCIHGQPLRAALYPPRCVLYRKEAAVYEDEGHGHRVRITGTVGQMQAEIAHDDRKPLKRWFESQMKYAEHEANYLTSTSLQELNRVDRLRRLAWLMPILTPVYCWLIKGLWRDGLPGLHYTLQRWVAECVIALAVVEKRLSGKGEDR